MSDKKPEFNFDPWQVLGIDGAMVIVRNLDRSEAMRFSHAKAKTLADGLVTWVRRLARELGEAAGEALMRHILDGKAPADFYEGIYDEVQQGRMGGVYAKKQRDRLVSSWFMADREEARARLRAIHALVIEVDRIRQVSPFATRLANVVLEAIILGDWAEAKRAAGDFRFTDESEEVQATYAALWSEFVVIAERESDLGIEREIEVGDRKVRARSVVPTPVKPSVQASVQASVQLPSEEPKEPKEPEAS
jgi:hypothetical protein